MGAIVDARDHLLPLPRAIIAIASCAAPRDAVLAFVFEDRVSAHWGSIEWDGAS